MLIEPGLFTCLLHILNGANGDLSTVWHVQSGRLTQPALTWLFWSMAFTMIAIRDGKEFRIHEAFGF